MSHAMIPNFSVPLVPIHDNGDRVPFHADPFHAAIEAHEKAYAVFQAAAQGGPTLRAFEAMETALEILLGTPCATRFGGFALIQYAVLIFGRGGTTPKRIRQYRELLPRTETCDARRTEIHQRHRVDELSDAYRDAGNAMGAARDALEETRTSTPEGLAVLARHLASYERGRIEVGRIGLLESAAIVGSVDLSAPGERRVRMTFA